MPRERKNGPRNKDRPFVVTATYLVKASSAEEAMRLIDDPYTREELDIGVEDIEAYEQSLENE